jgi:hypothetical protein
MRTLIYLLLIFMMACTLVAKIPPQIPLSVIISPAENRDDGTSISSEPSSGEAPHDDRDVITIGTGTSTQPQPFGMEYGYERSAAIYTSSEIGMSGSITQIRWYLSSSTSSAVPLRIYLKQTTSSSLSATTWNTTGATLVYQANVLFLNTGYNIFNLTTSFNYSSSSNLMILCETNLTGTGTTNYPTFRYTTSTNRHQYWRANTSVPTGNGTVNNRRPNIQLQIASSGLPDLTVDHGSISDRTLSPGDEFTIDWIVVNEGTGSAGSSYLKYYFSSDQSVGNDTYLEQQSIPSLDPDEFDDGTESISVPTSLTPGTWYLLLIADANDSVTESDESNNFIFTPAFTISTPQPSITVLYPNGGESLVAGLTYTVTWETANIPSSTNMAVVLRDEATNAQLIGVPVQNTGSCQWTITPELSGSDFRIYVGCSIGSDIYEDYSDNAFSIALSPPATPTDLMAIAGSATQNDLDWSDNSNNETGFRIERKTGSSGSWSEIATVGANVESYSNTGLTAGTGYYYRVRAYNASGNSSYSSEAIVPAAPSNLSATNASSTSISLTWTDNANNETGGVIQRRIGSGSWSNLAFPSANATSYTDTGLSSGTTYWYRVYCISSTGASWHSNEDDATPVLLLPDLTLSNWSLPAGLTVAPGGTVHITYTLLNNGNAVSGSSTTAGIYSADNNFSDNTTIDPVCGTSVESALGDGGSRNTSIDVVIPSNAAVGTRYLYVFVDHNLTITEQNENNNLSGAMAITVANIPVPPVAQPATSITQTSFQANWNASTGATGYRLDVSQAADFSSFISGYENCSVSGTSQTVSNLSAGYEYYYRVRAVNGAGTSASSNVITTLTSDPTIPTVRLSVPYYDQCQANWCFLTSVSMLMKYNGCSDTAKPWKIAAALGFDINDGVGVSNFTTVMNTINTTFCPGQWNWDNTLSFNPIKQALISIIPTGKPVMIYGIITGNGGHAIVVTGISQTGAYINDPSGAWFSSPRVNHFATWTELQGALDLFLGLGMMGYAYVNAPPPSSVSPLTFQSEHNSIIAENKLNTIGEGDHLLSLWWSALINDYGYYYIDESTDIVPNWYSNNNVFNKSFSLANRIEIPTIVSNSSVSGTSAQAKRISTVYRGNEIVCCRDGDWFNVDAGTSQYNGAEYLNKSSIDGSYIIEARLLQQPGTYRIHQELLNIQGTVVDSYDLYFSMESSSYASLETTLQTPVSVTIPVGSNGQSVIQITNRGSLHDSFNVYKTSASGPNLVGTTSIIAQNASVNQSVPIEVSSLPIGSTGTYDIIVVSNADTSKRCLLQVNYTVVAPAPPVVAVPFPDITLTEDFGTSTIALAGHFTDADSPTLTYAASSGNPGVVATISGNNIVLTSTANWNGIADITVTASDGTLSASDTFILTVTSVNDAPIVAVPFPDLALAEDFGTNTIALAGYFTDVDSPTLTNSVSSGNPGVTAAISGNNIVLTSTANWNGTADITVTASDGALSVNDTFIITVTPVNDAPVVAVPFPDITLTEDFGTNTIALAGHFTDVDSPNLTYTVTSSQTGVTAAIQGGNLVLTSTANWNGTANITVTADDGMGRSRSASRQNSIRASATGSFTLTVTPVNDSPVVAVPFEDIQVDENFAALSIPLAGHFSDADGTALTYSVEFDDTQILAEIQDTNLMLHAVENWFGETTVTVTADDGDTVITTRSISRRDTAASRLSMSDSFNVTVNEVGVGDHNIHVYHTALIGVYPNPFNPTTTISFSLAQPGQVQLMVYSIRGERVTTLINSQLDAGLHSVVWNGTDANGNPVASGVYFYCLQAGSRTMMGKCLMLK